MTIETFFKSASEEAVIYRYLELLSARTAELEQRLGYDEIGALRAENQQLRSQLATQERSGLEQLLVFLPVIFRNFWSVVRPDELALLAGTFQVPNIPSPYPEPSADTITTLKQRFLQLSEHQQASIIGFCRELQHRLEIRSEMRDLMKRFL